jgi:hypothetical protein
MTGMNELAFQKAEVYPNPFTSTLYVELGESLSEETNITLLDAQGRMIASLIASPQSTSVQFNQLDGIGSGMYFLKISDSKNERLMKVSKL